MAVSINHLARSERGGRAKMKIATKSFKSPQRCLTELEPFIRKGEPLRSGKPFRNFGGLRPREVLANWLLCVVGNYERQTWTFAATSDPIGGDGIICDSVTGETWPTEHVMVAFVGKAADAGDAILNAIASKQAKGGAAYAVGKTLVVFTDTRDARASWHPNKVARELPKPLDFASVWVVGLQGVQDGRYVYGVAHLDVIEGPAPTWTVRINEDFSAWEIERLQ